MQPEPCVDAALAMLARQRGQARGYGAQMKKQLCQRKVADIQSRHHVEHTPGSGIDADLMLLAELVFR